MRRTRERWNSSKAFRRKGTHKSAQRRTPRRPSCSGCTALVARLHIKRDLTRLVGPIERDGSMTSAQLSTACTAPHHAASHLLPRRQNRAWRPSTAAAESDGGDTRPAHQSRPSAPAAENRRPFMRAGEYCGWVWRPMPSYTPPTAGTCVDPAFACRQPPRPSVACRRLALLRGASRGHGLAGPVPLCRGRDRVAAVWLASRDASHAPRAPRSSGVLGGASADCCNVPGPPAPAAPGCGVVHPTHSVNPRPNPVDLHRVQSFNSAARKKVKNP